MKRKFMVGILALILGIGISNLFNTCFAMKEGGSEIRTRNLPVQVEEQIREVLDSRFLVSGSLTTQGNNLHWELTLSRLAANGNHDEASEVHFMAIRNDNQGDPFRYNRTNNHGYIGLGNENIVSREVFRKILLFLRENDIRNVLVETTIPEEKALLRLIGFSHIRVNAAENYNCGPVEVMLDADGFYDGETTEDDYYFMELTNFQTNPLNF